MSDELSLNVYTVKTTDSSGTFEYKPSVDNSNFYRQQDIFTKAKEKTKSTKEVENVTMQVIDNNASTRDKQAYDIAARPYNISGFKVMAGSDMYKKFLEINGDDFTPGVNDDGENVMLFDIINSDKTIRMFSVEVDEQGNEYYAIRDNKGNIFKFDSEGNAIVNQ